MSNYLIGDYIRDTRLRRGYTQEQLSFGICTTASLSRIRPVHRHPANIFWTRYWKGLESEIKYSMFW